VHEVDAALLKVGLMVYDRPAVDLIFCLQVSEKCPECGHLEAYSKEMQVRCTVWYRISFPFLNPDPAPEC
jgi:hypothetical protein